MTMSGPSGTGSNGEITPKEARIIARALQAAHPDLKGFERAQVETAAAFISRELSKRSLPETPVVNSSGLEYINGDLLASDEFYIMHGCNNQGFMESGIAAQIKKKYPVAYEEYRRHHELTGLRLGSFHLVDVNPGRRVINAITQTQGGIPVSYDAINQIFTDLNTVNLNPHKRIAIPRIGAGVAGGSWDIIESIIKTRAVKYEVCVYVYDPVSP